MPYEFDEGDPIGQMLFGARLTDAEVATLLADHDRLVARQRPFALVVDCSTLSLPPFAHVQALTHWIRDNFEAVERLHRGLACVITTPAIRGTLRAILHIQRFPMPVGVVDSVAAGFAFLDELGDPSLSQRSAKPPLHA